MYWLGKHDWQLAILRIVLGLALNNLVWRPLPIASPNEVSLQKVNTFTAGEGKGPAAWASHSFRNT